MTKIIKRILFVVVSLAAVGFIAYTLMKRNTKKHSPEATYSYFSGEQELIKVNYCRPAKKGREIFGGLVPFGKVWRTGANEATTIELSADLLIGGKPVRKGRYTLWTLPGAGQWEVYINSQMYPWGVDFDGNAQRDPAFDVAVISAPVIELPEVTELFTIYGPEDGTALWIEWDRTRIALPLGTIN